MKTFTEAEIYNAISNICERMDNVRADESITKLLGFGEVKHYQEIQLSGLSLLLAELGIEQG